jgi:hypothetical protein
MYQLTLNAEEYETLRDVLDCSISELHSEIVHTDRSDLRNCLKDRKQVLLHILERIKSLENTKQQA